MSLEMKRFVDGIADMGFSRARVARTVRKLGQDDKKVRKSFFLFSAKEHLGYCNQFNKFLVGPHQFQVLFHH